MARAAPDYEPTPEEIKSACQRFQQGWSPEERQRRRWLATHTGMMPPLAVRDAEAAPRLPMMREADLLGR
jgi:hypothetical protein